MAENTAIEWCDSTFNPWIGCTAISPGCANCYAAALAKRTGRDFSAPTRTSPTNWVGPLKWEREHAAFHAQHGRRRRVFCASMADVFDTHVDPAWRADLFALISETPHLDWLLLTKRIGNAKEMIADAVRSLYWEDESGEGVSAPEWPWSHVWLGATVVNQAEYDRDIGKLLRTPARVHFLSVEPMLGPIDMRMGGASVPDYSAHRPLARLDWVICGGESGHGARPMHPSWARSLRDQCAAAGVAFTFKQWGEWAPTWFEAHRYLGLDAPPDPAGVNAIAGTGMGERPHETLWPVVKVGKKTAGRMLDGVEHNGFPLEGAEMAHIRSI